MFAHNRTLDLSKEFLFLCTSADVVLHVSWCRFSQNCLPAKYKAQGFFFRWSRMQNSAWPSDFTLWWHWRFFNPFSQLEENFIKNKTSMDKEFTTSHKKHRVHLIDESVGPKNNIKRWKCFSMSDQRSFSSQACSKGGNNHRMFGAIIFKNCVIIHLGLLCFPKHLGQIEYLRLFAESHSGPAYLNTLGSHSVAANKLGCEKLQQYAAEKRKNTHQQRWQCFPWGPNRYKIRD